MRIGLRAVAAPPLSVPSPPTLSVKPGCLTVAYDSWSNTATQFYMQQGRTEPTAPVGCVVTNAFTALMASYGCPEGVGSKKMRECRDFSVVPGAIRAPKQSREREREATPPFNTTSLRFCVPCWSPFVLRNTPDSSSDLFPVVLIISDCVLKVITFTCISQCALTKQASL